MLGKHTYRILLVLTIVIGIILAGGKPLEFSFNSNAALVTATIGPTINPYSSYSYESYGMTVSSVSQGSCNASSFNFTYAGSFEIDDTSLRNSISGVAPGASFTISGYRLVYVWDSKGRLVNSGAGNSSAIQAYPWSTKTANTLKSLCYVSATMPAPTPTPTPTNTPTPTPLPAPSVNLTYPNGQTVSCGTAINVTGNGTNVAYLDVPGLGTVYSAYYSKPATVYADSSSASDKTITYTMTGANSTNTNASGYKTASASGSIIVQHTYTNWVYNRTITSPTCTDSGVDEYKRTDPACGRVEYKNVTTAALGHLAGPETLVPSKSVAATYNTQGYNYYETRCTRIINGSACNVLLSDRYEYYYTPRAVPSVNPTKFILGTTLNSSYISDNSTINQVSGSGRTDTITSKVWTLKYPDGTTATSTASIPSFALNQLSKSIGDYKLSLQVMTSPLNVSSNNTDNYVTFTVGPKTSIDNIDINIYNDGAGMNDSLSVSNVTATSSFTPSSVLLELVESGTTVKKSYTLTRTSSTGTLSIATNWSDVVNSDLGFNLDKTKNYAIRATVNMNDALGNASNSTFNFPVVAQDTKITRNQDNQDISNGIRVVDKGDTITLTSYDNSNADSVTVTADKSIFKVGGVNTSTVTLPYSTTTGGYKVFTTSVQLATSGGDYGTALNNNVLSFKSVDSSGNCTNIEENRIKPNWYFSGDLTVKAVRDLAWKSEYVNGTRWAVDKAGSLQLPVQFKPTDPNINAPIKLGYGVDFSINTIQVPLDSNTKVTVDATFKNSSGTDITGQIYDGTLKNKPLLAAKYKHIEILGNDRTAAATGDPFSIKVTPVTSLGTNGGTWGFMYYLPTKLYYSSGTKLSGNLTVNFVIKVFRNGTQVFNYDNIGMLKHSWNGDAFIYTTDKTLLDDIGGSTTY